MEDTLYNYFERGEKAGVIDYSLRIVRSPEGQLDFYIHPTDKDGETGDFTVSGAFVMKMGVGAGSSRKTFKLVGSGADDEDDIVKRLRAPAYWLSGSEDQHEGDNDAPLEAADEIDTLRAELSAERERAGQMEFSRDQLRTRYDELSASNTKCVERELALREALREARDNIAAFMKAKASAAADHWDGVDDIAREAFETADANAVAIVARLARLEEAMEKAREALTVVDPCASYADGLRMNVDNALAIIDALKEEKP